MQLLEDPVPLGAAAEEDATGAGAADDATGAGAAELGAAVDDAEPEVIVSMVVTVTAAPPLALAEPCVELGAAELAGAAPPAPPEPDAGAPSPEQPEPVGVCFGYTLAVVAALPEGNLVVTYWPGYGNKTSTPSVVGQLLTSAILATNIVGKSFISDPSPPLSSVLMQFMYSSRLPTVLYHVQAMIA